MLKLLKFSAIWCSPCRALEPELNKVLKEFPDIVFEKIDVDRDTEGLGKLFNINSVPTLVLLKDGVELKRMMGLQSAEKLRRFLN